VNGGDGIEGRSAASEVVTVDRMGFKGCANTCAMARLEASAGLIPRSISSNHCLNLFFVLFLLPSLVLLLLLLLLLLFVGGE
jgi:hypothetical protein